MKQCTVSLPSDVNLEPLGRDKYAPKSKRSRARESRVDTRTIKHIVFSDDEYSSEEYER